MWGDQDCLKVFVFSVIVSLMAGRRLFNFVNCTQYVLYTHVTKINYSTITTIK